MNNQKHNRRSIRLKGYDYSQAVTYFVTICTQNRECLFGEIINGEMVLNEVGKIINGFCVKTEHHFQNIIFDSFIIMPNHFHVMIKIVGAGSPCPDNMDNIDGIENGNGRYGDGRGDPAPTVGNIVGYFKYQTTKQINVIRESPGQKLWQRNYYEHIIRDENDYNRIYEYIQNNPLQWQLDSLHPKNVGAGSPCLLNGE